MKLYGGSVRRLAHPQIKIFAFACLEKKHIVAVVKFGQFVQLIELRFGVEL